ncbi:hypothetical protein CHLNCDRAFT_143310 [Chlorella variabilis]|uniref:Ubiquinol oxidase n=1 Tax=Chlorella variabilis TaxID=554065 RepID=E1Z9Y0_CHLVA|nr:hypothetical protein CHLNCDRAFT_143310 [Chlorella variabilis]EFN57853.1 hypothetical protein CHLNCDRAFT_143310 [Chlorella variabilis]|eukprot:XP_005849955.1 hypothetical protein CHLNCDRAFT_143310 [Chlorella variabilis]
MVETKTVGSADGTPPGGAASHRTFGAGYIAPHPSIRKDAVDVDSYLQEHQVYTSEYLESVQPAHEYAAWYWHVAARTLVGLLTGTLGAPADRLTERSLGKRILCFTSVGTVSGLAGKPWGRGAVFNHVRSILFNKPDNGWVHTAAANAECVRAHAGIVANTTWTPAQPPLWARLFHLMFQARVVMFLQILPVYFFLPSAAYAYDAFRAEEQVYSQAISLIGSGRFKTWKSTRAPGLGVSYYALPEGAMLRDALLRMRADEACIHQLNIVLAELNPGDKNPFITMERKSK